VRDAAVRAVRRQADSIVGGRRTPSRALPVQDIVAGTGDRGYDIIFSHRTIIEAREGLRCAASADITGAWLVSPAVWR